MKSIVVYATRTGITKSIALLVGEALRQNGDVEVHGVDDAPTRFDDVDLLVVGGPTEAHGVTEPVKAFFARIGPDGLRGKATAAFDTRVNWPRILSGSAATGIARALHAAGAHLVMPAESFIVDIKPQLLPGELERAAVWARALAAKSAASRPAMAGAAT
jgi:hypothetical protein